MSHREKRSGPFNLDELLPSLRPAEARLADYIRKHPHDVIQLSITDLAERSGISEATVVRLCRRLGFRRFQDFRVGLAQSLVGPVQMIHEEIVDDDTVETAKAKVFGASVQALQDTLSVLDSREFSRAVEIIDSAPKISFAGAGSSSWVCMDAALKFMKVRIDASAYTDGHSQLVAATLLSPGSVCLGISHSGATRDTIEALEAAKAAGAHTISITGTPKSPLTRIADVNLFTSAKETAFKTEAMTSRIAQFAIVDALFVSVALRRNSEAVDGIHRVREATAIKRL